MQAHQPPNTQFYRELGAPTTVASVSLESLCTNKPSSLELILVWDLVPEMRIIFKAVVVLQNLIKTTVRSDKS